MGERTVLVTGGAGYLGSLLTRELLDNGKDVIVYDNFRYGWESLADIQSNDNLSIVEGDVRDRDHLGEAIQRADDIVHLAAIVGKPACAERVDEAIETNIEATISVKKLAAEHEIEKFIFSSTCSVYGDYDSDSLIDEESDLNPKSLYAMSKRVAEQSLLENPLGLDVSVLRFATVYGLSPRPRFDLAINILTKLAVFDGEGTIYGGDQWRPFIYTTDVARAIEAALEAPTEDMSGEIFNVGHTNENYTMAEVGQIIGEAVPTADITIDKAVTDDRTYRVNFDKVRNQLGFEPEISLRGGIVRIRDALKEGYVENPENPSYVNHGSGGLEVE